MEDKKKNIIIIILILIIIILGILIAVVKNTKSYTEDEKKFKEEYESLNGTKSKNSGKKIMEVTIPKDNNIKYITSKEVIDILKNKTGVIYFGFPECPWCRNAIPVLINAANCECLDEVYYFNALSIRDIKHLDENGKIITDKEGTKDYYEIVKILGDKLSSYEGLNDASIKRLYFPTVVFVRDGEIVDLHISTVDDQKDPSKELTKKQKEDLLKIYKDGIKKIKTNPNTCDGPGKTTC